VNLLPSASLSLAAAVPALAVGPASTAWAPGLWGTAVQWGGDFAAWVGPDRSLLLLAAVVALSVSWFAMVRGRMSRKATDLKRELAHRERAEQALRESEEKYRILVENANEAVVVIQDSRVVFVNRKGCEALGYEREELDRSLFVKVIHPDDREVALARHRRRLAGEPVDDPHRMRVTDAHGRTLWVELTGVVIRWQGRDAVLNFMTDITERKRAEDVVRVQVDLSRALSGPLTLSEGLAKCIEAARAVSDLDSGCGYILDEVSGALRLGSHVGFSDRFVACVSEYAEETALARLVLKGDPVCGRFADAFADRGAAECEEGALAVAIVPIKHEGRVVGCLSMASHATDEIPPSAVSAVEAVASRAGGAIAAKRAEQDLKESRRFLQSVFDGIRDGITVLDCDHNVLRVNAWVEELYKHRAPFVGRKCYEIFMDRSAPCPWCPCARAIQSGDRRTEVMPYPAAARASRWMEISAFPLTDESGRAVAVIKHMRDITSRRQAEKVQSVLFQISQAVHTAENLGALLKAIHYQLGRLIDTTNFYVALYDEETETYSFPYMVDQYEQERTIPPAQVLRKSLTDYVRRTGKPVLVDEAFHQSLEAAGEVELIGRPSPVWLGVPLRTAQKVIGVVVAQSYDDPTLYSPRDLDLLSFVAENIAVAIERKLAEDERLRLEAQIQHSQKLESLGVLAGGIAHDFNNLLTGILGNADLALLSEPAESQVVQSVREIKKTAERAADLSRQMLAYSGRGSFIIETIDLNAVVREMGNLLDVSISKRAVLTYELMDSLPVIVGDATQIRQVLMNLITNASDAVGDGDGLLTIRTGRRHCDRAYLAETYLDDQLPEGDYVYLEVEDTGCGMDEETLQKMFDPFFTTKFTGRGLGLAAVLGIIRGHRGAIDVSSEVGHGTVFRVLFPMTGEASVSIAQKPAEPAGMPVSGGMVLLVDDEQAVRDVASRMLEQAGFRVVSAADGTEAVAVFGDRAGEIGCVLLDLTMPRMGGEEAFRELKGIRPDVRVVVSSGYSEQEVARRFAGEDVAGFVQKPYLYETLVTRVAAALQESQGGQSPAVPPDAQ